MLHFPVQRPPCFFTPTSIPQLLRQACDTILFVAVEIMVTLLLPTSLVCLLAMTVPSGGSCHEHCAPMPTADQQTATSTLIASPAAGGRQRGSGAVAQMGATGSSWCSWRSPPVINQQAGCELLCSRGWRNRVHRLFAWPKFPPTASTGRLTRCYAPWDP
jgi:hypothetical protein